VRRAARAPALPPRAQEGSVGDFGARFMAMLEVDLERAGKFVSLQVEDIQLRSRALAARAAAATAAAELDRIEGACISLAHHRHILLFTQHRPR
jgi:hypothetical protein